MVGGSSAFTLHIVRTSQEFEEALALRYEVFCDEQRIPRDVERDAEDDVATHVVLRDSTGTVVGTGRALRQLAGERLVALTHAGTPDDLARIGRMAVKAAGRKAGLGRRVIEALEAECRTAGLRMATLHAQVSAEPFYAHCGYTRFGEEFAEVDIPHVEMRKTLLGGSR